MRILIVPPRAVMACALALALSVVAIAPPSSAPFVSASGAAVAYAQTQPESAVGDTTIPKPVGFVNDLARLMDESTQAKLEAFLDQVKRKTTVEFAVLTVPTSAPYDPAEYKTIVFQRWHLGQKGKDNGLLLLVSVQEHKIWFETGYGVEGTLPDAMLSRIIREEMTPRFRAGDWAGGITAAVLRVSSIIAKEQGVTLEWNGRELRYSGSSRSRSQIPIFWIALVIFIIVTNIATYASRGGRGRRFGGWGPWYGGFGGGMGGGWGGGFGGGGGGGGGGFGGFGGGSSGGGGGGGGW